jgi:hypothetical protein
MEFTRRPAYAVVPQCGPAKTSDRTIHWIDLYMGPITWQIRDTAGLRSARCRRRHRLPATRIDVRMRRPGEPNPF